MSRRKPTFNILLAGNAGSGKSSFINTLFKKKMVEVNRNKAHGDIDVYVMDVDCEGIKKRMTVVDTPGFGSTLDDTFVQESIVSYIKTQYDTFLAEETKIKRNVRNEDTRIHVMIYFILPRSHGLRKTDLEFLRKISTLVNVVPVISKADQLTQEELRRAKERISRQFITHKINTFDFCADSVPNSKELNLIKPFSIICNDWSAEDGGEMHRQYLYGAPCMDNPAHCDFSILKEILFTSYTDLLVDFTTNDLYEDYRAEVLSNILPAN